MYQIFSFVRKICAYRDGDGTGKPLYMSASSTRPFQEDERRKARQKMWVTTVVVIVSLMFLCILSMSVRAAIRIVDSMRPKTHSFYYEAASIDHMFKLCQPVFYNGWESWMQPVAGYDTVLSLEYSKSAPLPDAFYAYDLFIQLNSSLLVPGKELSFTTKGVKPLLIDVPAPLVYCSTDLNGSIKILEASDQSVKALLEVNGVINHNPWEYNGEVQYMLSLLPK